MLAIDIIRVLTFKLFYATRDIYATETGTIYTIHTHHSSSLMVGSRKKEYYK